MEKNNKGLRKWIKLLAGLILGEAYINGFDGSSNDDEDENVTYKFESIYPDIETMNAIEKKLRENNMFNKTSKLA